MKAQTQVVSVILIIGIAFAAIATILPWSMSMIQKRKDAKTVDDVFNFFLLLENKIKTVAQTGGEEVLELKVPGKLTVYPYSTPQPLRNEHNNSIYFVFSSKVSNIAPGEWLCLSTNCNQTATLGKDSFGVIIARATKGDDSLLIEYKLWYRDLVDKETGQMYKIFLNTTSNEVASTTIPFLRIQKLRTYSTQSLTITEINIII
ncbi:MAG: hypothetical protein N3E38_00960 [Candidatus Aenigmarchaeota archaeon]|nr:hypothetical protein [Candidatus Aenigmarchaeota archaeon]